MHITILKTWILENPFSVESARIEMIRGFKHILESSKQTCESPVYCSGKSDTLGGETLSAVDSGLVFLFPPGKHLFKQLCKRRRRRLLAIGISSEALVWGALRLGQHRN